MKKFSIAKYSVLASLLVAVTTLTGCRNEFDFEEARGEKFVKDKLEEYKNSFEETFCADGQTIDPTHNWGFEELQVKGQTKSLTRAVNANSNEWEKSYNVPTAITSTEAEYVYNYFVAHSSDKQGQVSLNYTDFFVQHVWKGTDSYETVDQNGAKHQVVGGNQMDKLCAANNDHVNNFNACTGSIMLMVNSSASSFSYEDSWGDRGKEDGNYSKSRNKYLILNIPGYGTYLGFDYETYKNDGQRHEGDGVYTDWIIKVSDASKDASGTINDAPSGETPEQPGQTEPEETWSETKSVRVMCEDLGAIGDFDYNDVVFDVMYLVKDNDPTQIRARITVLAAGGTLPLYVAGHEVHELFGVTDSRQMINTNNANRPGYNKIQNIVDRAAQTFYIDVTSTNPNDIPVVVHNNGQEITLTSEIGTAPGKICVPVTVNWSNETEPISVVYSKFRVWVSDKSVRFWNDDEKALENPVVDEEYGTQIKLLTPDTQKEPIGFNIPAYGNDVEALEITFKYQLPYSNGQCDVNDLMLQNQFSSINWNNSSRIDYTVTKDVESNGYHYTTFRINVSNLSSSFDYICARSYNIERINAVYVKYIYKQKQSETETPSEGTGTGAEQGSGSGNSQSGTTTGEIVLWEGEVVADDWSNQPGLLSNGGTELNSAGASVGNLVRFYITPTEGNWNLQVYNGHWDMQMCDFNQSNWNLSDHNGAVEIQLSQDILNLLLTVQEWGGTFVLNGDNVKCTKVTLVK